MLTAADPSSPDAVRERNLPPATSQPQGSMETAWPDESPRTAFCIAGSARSFATPLVLRLLRAHLVEPLGGSRASTRLFFLLKTGDSPKVRATRP